MLSLDKQNEYRRRYRAINPQWQASGDVYERLVRESLLYSTQRSDDLSRPAAEVATTQRSDDLSRLATEVATTVTTTRLLDLGGGRGGLIELIHGEVGFAAALDPDLISLREHRVRTLPRACGLADSIPFPADQFDCVTATWLIEHLAEPERVFGEVRRVLRPGGRFVFLTPNAHHPLVMANRLSQLAPAIQRRLVPRLYARREADTFVVRYRANTGKRLRAVCERVGFNLELKFVGDPTYTAFNASLFKLSAFLETFIPNECKIHIIGVAVK